MDKRLLLLCKERNAKILAILSEQDPADVMEFQTTIQMVQVVVNRLINGKKEIKLDVEQLDQIYRILGSYGELLEEYIASGRLRRLLTSSRMRKKIEQINSKLHSQLKVFVETLKDLNVPSANANSSSQPRVTVVANATEPGTEKVGLKPIDVEKGGLKPIDNAMTQSGLYRTELKKAKKAKKEEDKKKKKKKSKKLKKPKRATLSTPPSSTYPPVTDSGTHNLTVGSDTTTTDDHNSTVNSTDNTATTTNATPPNTATTTTDASNANNAASGTHNNNNNNKKIDIVSKAQENGAGSSPGAEAGTGTGGGAGASGGYQPLANYGEGPSQGSTDRKKLQQRYASIIDLAGKKLAKEHQYLRHLTNEVITDNEGKEMWARLFGAETLYVEWDDFVRELATVLKAEISEDDKTLLKHILDNSGTNYVSMYKWSEVLKGFGPISELINNVRSVLTAPWFHGFLTSREAELLLEDQPIGTFLIRFSRSSAGSFALAFVKSPKNILHILIQSCAPQGFKIVEDDGDKSKMFKSIFDLIKHYHIFLRAPFISDLPRESWFHGDVSSQEAGELLAGQPEGTFLLRFSSQPGCFAASYVAVGTSEVKHALIQGLPTGFLFAGEKDTFPTLKELIHAYSYILKHPLPNVENDLAPVLRRYLEAKKAKGAGLGPIPDHYCVVESTSYKN